MGKGGVIGGVGDFDLRVQREGAKPVIERGSAGKGKGMGGGGEGDGEEGEEEEKTLLQK